MKEGITLTLSPEKSEEFFHNALCNSLDYMCGYGLEFDYDEDEYKASREKLTNPCFEDVLMQMLKDGYKLTFVDVEGEAYTSSITLKDVHERVSKTPFEYLSDMIEERDDANTGDVILQTVFFEDIIFA